MKKYVFLMIFFFVCGVMAFSQSWTIYGDNGSDWKYTVISKERFDRIVKVQEQTALSVRLDYLDGVLKRNNLISGSIPDFNGNYYIYAELVPKNEDARKHGPELRAAVMYGNSRTGIMSLMYFSIWLRGNILLKSDWDSYVQEYKKLINLVNDE